jgi:predicted Holliday junction resolvase-like endonuclease
MYLLSNIHVGYWRRKMIEILIGSVIAILAIWILFRRKLKTIQQELKKAQSALRSCFVKHGQTFEQHIPFAKDFKDKETFKFLGQPIDGVAFRDDRIILYEFKTGLSQLNAKQKKIKKLVENGAVEFIELRY